MLFSDFSPTRSDEWRAKIERDLKGKASVDDLKWQTENGFAIDAFYHLDEQTQTPPPLPPSALRATDANTWLIHESIRVNDVTEANKTAIAALTGGTESLQFVLDTAPLNGLNTLLDGVFIEMIHLSFSGQWVWRQPETLVEMLKKTLESRNIDAKDVHITLAADPLNTHKIDAIIAQTLDFEHFRCVDLYCTGNATQQLSQLIKSAKTLINKEPILLNRLQLVVPIGSSFITETAKLRALRLLWQAHISAESAPLILAYTAPQTLVADADYNKIKATTQAMSAIIGGADKLQVTPSDAMLEADSSDFARRIARNVQHILRLESHLDKVIDPSAGSYTIEKMTAELVAAAEKHLI